MLLFALLSCKDPPPADRIAEWVEEQGIDFRDCGGLALGQCVDGAADPADQVLINCITGAFASCDAATFELSQPTIEGDRITTTWFVVPTEAGCTVTQFTDNTQDAFGDGLLHQYTCTGLVESADCPWLGAEGCVELD